MSSEPLIIDGGILAGGLARRMNGLDKGLQVFKDKPMATWVFDALSPHVRTVIINCNRNESVYRTISPHITSDAIAGFQGPLAGISSLLEASDADYLLISPCDSPLLKPQFALKLLQALHHSIEVKPNSPHLLAVKVGDKHQPLHLCISRLYIHSIQQFLAAGHNRVMQWMHENNAQWVEFPETEDSFKNFNTLSEVNTH